MSKKIGCASLLIRRLCMSHLLMDELHRCVMVQNTLIRATAVPVLHECCVAGQRWNDLPGKADVVVSH